MSRLTEAMLNGVVVRNDTLVVELHARKIYGLQPKLVVTISPLAMVQPVLPLAALGQTVAQPQYKAPVAA